MHPSFLPLFGLLSMTSSSPLLLRLMPYQAYPFHWPLVHWPQRAYDPRVVADGFKCKTSGNFPSESCDSYFTCVEEASGLKAYTVSCPAGLNYNPSIEKCDWPENAPCASSQENGDGGAPQTAPVLVEVAEDFDCTTEGVFQDPDNCSRYFACNIKAGNSNLASQFVAYAIDCPPGLAFAVREDGWKGCDWPPEGGCEGLEEPQWAQDEDEGDSGVVEEAKVIMDV